jgi:hypothetical protein
MPRRAADRAGIPAHRPPSVGSNVPKYVAEISDFGIRDDSIEQAPRYYVICGAELGRYPSAQLPEERRSSRVQSFPDDVDRLTKVDPRRDRAAEMRF